MKPLLLQDAPLPRWLLSLLLFFAGIPAHAELNPVDIDRSQLVASLHPLALVAASVLPPEQISTLVPGNVSPHDFSLKPSHIRLLQQADVVLWSGAESEPYLLPFVARWPQKLWLDISEIVEQSPAHQEHFSNGSHSSEDGEHEEHGNHHWLSPTLMIEVQAQLARAFGQLQLADTFAQAVTAQLARDRQRLAPVQARGFFVFHQAYDYWVEAQALNQLGAFSLTPQQKPGLRKLQAMRQQLQQGQVACVFSEPQFSDSLLQSLTRGLSVAHGELDPLGRHIAISRNGYIDFLDDLSQRALACLSAG